jgi:metal-responsive CopG/Arc/MetJ family transcriptional regulator
MAVTIAGADIVEIPVPADLAGTIDVIAKARHVSRDRATADLLREAIAAYEDRRAAFLELAARFQESTDPSETDELRGDLAQMTFGR